MLKKYSNKNVYEATQDRLKILFEEFDNIYISFSSGKDSTAMLHTTLQYYIQNNLKKNITILIIDWEAMYKTQDELIFKIIDMYKDYANFHWVCLPLTSWNSVSQYQNYWTAWDKKQKDKRIRNLPDSKYVIHQDNNIFDFYKESMWFEDFIVEYAKWQSKNNGKTACLIGIRAEESFDRYLAIVNSKKNFYKKIQWSSSSIDNCYNFYPIYDWRVEDIWCYLGKYSLPYNKLYDYFYKAGLKLNQMRICEPFGVEARKGLNLFKIIEPATWLKLLERTTGINFANIYDGTKALAYNKVDLPKNHTWKSYTKFLLKTLPEHTKNIYLKKFITYIKYWKKHGSAFDKEIIEELTKKYPQYFIKDKVSTRSVLGNNSLKCINIPDYLEDLSTNKDIINWKKMALTILRNDISCKRLGFSFTKEKLYQQIKKIETINKWSSQND